jgi:hypothetical protein
MQVLASTLKVLQNIQTVKVLQSRALLRPHHDDRKQKLKSTPLYTS